MKGTTGLPFLVRTFRRPLRLAGWAALAGALLHLLHGAAALPVATVLLHDFIDLPFALAHRLGPWLRWGGLAATAAAAAAVLGHGLHLLARRVVIFRT